MIPEPQATIPESVHGLSAGQMKEVLEISRLFAITADLETLLQKIAQAACRLLECEVASIWLHDALTNELYTTVVMRSEPLRVPANSGIVGAAFNSNRVVAVHDAYTDPRFNPSVDTITGFRTRSLMATPMVDINGVPIGVIESVNKIGLQFSAEDQALVQLLADQAGVAIQRHRLQLMARHAGEMQREMNLARAVKKGLLPKTLPTLAGFDFFCWEKSASTIGGDCYDLWQLADGRLGIFVADASGHGLAPALVVSQARTLVRALCNVYAARSSPHDVLVRVNQQICDDLDQGRFITAFLGFLAPDGTLDWQSAGHGPILVRTSGETPIECLNPLLPPIGVISDLPDTPPPRISLQSGGMLAVISDGIYESFDPSRQQFGVERVIDSLQQSQDQSAADAGEALLASVAEWQQHDQPTDDQTILLLNRRG
jgi:serine phosphatase RsbU (regulator of sigma subunit)